MRGMTYSADKAVGMPFAVQCCHTYLIDDRFIAGATVRSEQLYITGPAVGLVIVFVITLRIILQLTVAVLAQEVLRVPCLAHCCQTFLTNKPLLESILNVKGIPL